MLEVTGERVRELPGEPTRERLRHGVVVEGIATGSDAERAIAGARVRRAVSPLDRYRSAGLVTHRQADAAELWRLDYEVGYLGVRLEEGGGSSPGAGYLDRRLDAVQRWSGAAKALGRLRPIVQDVVMSELTAGTVATRRRGGVKGVMALLRCGLDVLGDCYGLGG